MELKIWSNAFFLVPLAVSVSLSLYMHALIITGVFVVSLLYHSFDEKKFEAIDKFFACLLRVSPSRI
jgi:hypothetical protein